MPTLLAGLGPLAFLLGLSSLGFLAWAIFAAVRGHSLRAALLAYASCTTAAIAYWRHFIRPGAFPPTMIEVGPYTDFELTHLMVAATWAWLGVLLIVISRGRPWTIARGAYWIALTLIVAFTADTLRERVGFGDVHDYILAAEQLASGQALHARYLYPPLLATLLVPLVKFGPHAIFVACVGANLAAVALLFVLLRSALMRYRYSELAATIVSFLAICANVAIVRTLFYVQVNVHITNLMLLSLIAYPVSPIASACALALAAHIKTSPLALALPFLLARDWKWLTWFGVALLALVGLTTWLNGFQHYYEYLDNVANVYRANGIAFRDNSVDSFIRATVRLFEIDLERAAWPIRICKAALFCFSLWLVGQSIMHRSFVPKAAAVSDPQRREEWVLGTYPILMLLLMMLSPLVWEHHPVMIMLSMLVPLRLLQTRTDFLLWLVAYFVTYCIPTFDAYPFSYRITVGGLLLYWLYFRLVRRAPGQVTAFERVDGALTRLATEPLV